MQFFSILIFTFTMIKTGSKIPVFYLDSIVVKREAAFPIYSINDSLLREKKIKGTENLINLLPSLTFVTTKKGYGIIQLRDANEKEVKVLLDGIPLNIPYSGNFDITEIPSGFINSLSVLLPTNPIIMGTNAMGGIISISTLNIEDSKFVDISGGKGGVFRNTAAFGQSKKRFGYVLGMSYEKRDEFRISSSNPYTTNLNRKNSYFVKKGVLGKLLLKSRFGNFKLNTLLLDNSKGVPWDLASSRKRFWRFTVWRKGEISIRYTYKGIKLGTFYDKYYNVLDSYDDSTFTSQTKRYAFHSTYNDHSNGFYMKSSLHRTNRSLYFILGLKSDVHREQPDKDREWEELRSLSGNSAVYFSSYLKGIQVQTGVEYMLFKQDLRTNTSFCPFISLRAIRKKLSVSGSYAKRTRFPTLKEMYSTYSGSAYPNPDLKPEHSDNIELNISSKLNNALRLNIGLYFSRYTDLIEKIKVDSLYKTVNIGMAKSYGMDMKTGGKINNITYSLSLDLQKATDNNNNPLDLKPPVRIVLSVSKPLIFNTKLSTDIVYTGRRYETTGDSTIELSPFTLFNLTLEKKIDRYVIYLKINNAFDEFYEYIHGFPGQGRYTEAGMKIEF